MSTASEMSRLLLWKRGAPVEEPPAVNYDHYASKRRMTCECGESWHAGQFAAWDAHECAFTRARTA